MSAATRHSDQAARRLAPASVRAGGRTRRADAGALTEMARALLRDAREAGASEVRSRKGANEVRSREGANEVRSRKGAPAVRSREGANEVRSREGAPAVRSREGASGGADVEARLGCAGAPPRLRPYPFAARRA